MFHVIVYADIDECSTGEHACSYQCANTDGSYSCLCPTGFQLLEDNHTCLGEMANVEPILHKDIMSYTCIIIEYLHKSTHNSSCFIMKFSDIIFTLLLIIIITCVFRNF